MTFAHALRAVCGVNGSRRKSLAEGANPHARKRIGAIDRRFE